MPQDATGKNFLLDHMAERTGGGGIADSVLLQRVDFERDQTGSYVLGPLPQVPSSIRLRNDAPGVGDIVEGLWNDMKAAVESFWGEKFAGTFVDELETRRGDFLPALSGAIAPDWKPRWVDAFAFKRDRRVETSHMLDRLGPSTGGTRGREHHPDLSRRSFKRVTLPRH